MSRALILTLLLVLSPIAAPAALGHACSGTASDCTCPVPNDGQAHSHAGPSGSCTNGASATPGGASVPGPALAVVLVAFAVLALARRR